MSSSPISPQVSGIMAARNCAAYVGEAIESALFQIFPDFELLVVDDESTDETADIVAALATRDSRVRLICLPEQIGQWAARNVALQEARGEWIAILDADDRWRPRRLEAQLEAVARDPSVRLVTSKYLSVDAQGRPLEIVSCARPDGWLRWRLLFGNSIGGHSQVLFHRETALACGGYQGDMDDSAQDYQLWIDLAGRGGIACVDEVLMDYRQHAQSVSAVKRDGQRSEAQRISNQALTALLGVELPPERLAALRHFWSGTFPLVFTTIPELADDQRQLEEAFWRHHPALVGKAECLMLSLRRRRQWARYARHLFHLGHTLAASHAGRHALG